MVANPLTVWAAAPTGLQKRHGKGHERRGADQVGVRTAAPLLFARVKKTAGQNTLTHIAPDAGIGRGILQLAKPATCRRFGLRGRRLSIHAARICLGRPCAAAPRPFHTGSLSALDLLSPSPSPHSPACQHLGGHELPYSRHPPTRPEPCCRLRRLARPRQFAGPGCGPVSLHP